MLKQLLPKQKKRYIFFASMSLLIHIIGVVYVILSLSSNSFSTNMNFTRYMLGLKEHDHNNDVIMKIWMIGIQIRYLITDYIIFRNAHKNKELLRYYIKNHTIEGLILFIILLFYTYYYNNKDCVIFCGTCFIWTSFWLYIYYSFLLKKTKLN